MSAGPFQNGPRLLRAEQVVSMASCSSVVEASDLFRGLVKSTLFRSALERALLKASVAELAGLPGGGVRKKRSWLPPPPLPHLLGPILGRLSSFVTSLIVLTQHPLGKG